MGFNCFKLIVTSEISYFSIKLKLMLESNNLIIMWPYSLVRFHYLAVFRSCDSLFGQHACHYAANILPFTTFCKTAVSPNAFYSSQLLLVSHACLILKFVMVTKILLSEVLNKYM